MSKLRGKASTIRQRGAALVVGMILLLILTVLGVSGMNSSVFGLTMASNAQFFQNAFQAAETGIDIAIDQRNYTTAPITRPRR
jgi:type IV pilus assembly protein PilX